MQFGPRFSISTWFLEETNSAGGPGTHLCYPSFKLLSDIFYFQEWVQTPEGIINSSRFSSPNFSVTISIITGKLESRLYIYIYIYICLCIYVHIHTYSFILLYLFLIWLFFHKCLLSFHMYMISLNFIASMTQTYQNSLFLLPLI